MLKEVLREINSSGYISKSNMALKLNKSEALIEDAFSQLIRMGYIAEYDMNDCDTPCRGCPYAKACSKTPIRTLMVTDKGRRLLDK